MALRNDFPPKQSKRTANPPPRHGLLELDTLVDLEPLVVSDASLCKNSENCAAKESVLPLPSLVMNSVDSDGVLGVRCQGDMGVRRFGLDAPGRARPACSRCSVVASL